MKNQKAALISIIGCTCVALLVMSGFLLKTLLNSSQTALAMQQPGEVTTMSNVISDDSTSVSTTDTSSETTDSTSSSEEIAEGTSVENNAQPEALPAELSDANYNTVQFEDNGQVLHNPLMGWQYYAFPKEILTTGVPDNFDIIVIETSWDVLEPEDNQYDWTMLDRSIRKLRDLGKTVYLRLYLMPDDVWSIEGTPKWLWTKYNVPYQEVQGKLNATGEYNLRHPLYWDATYQAKMKEFLSTFASHYKDGAADIIDMRCYGIYGEWDSKWLPFDWKGDTALKTKTLNQLLNIYYDTFKNYKHTRIAINVPADEQSSFEGYKKEAAFDTAMSDGFAIRFDGVGDRYTANIFPSQLINENFPKAPVFAETYYGFDDLKFSVKNTVKAFTYYHVNGATFGFYKGNYTKMLERHQDSFDEGLKEMGYRLLPLSIQYPTELSAGQMLTLTSTWENLGVGVCYNQYPLAVKLVDSNGNTVYKEVDFKFNETLWKKGESHLVTSNFKLANSSFLPSGTYTLVISLVDENLRPAIALPIDAQANGKEYTVGTIQIN